MPLTKSIGERIKALRTERRLTLAGLGEKVTLSVSYLSQIERDKTTPSLSTLMDIAKVLNVGLRYFF
jgi:transcriptional regulator with XRE-family HTH domain